MKAWAWLTGNLLTVAVVAIAAFLIVTQVQGCRDKGDSEFDAVMEERIRLDSLRAVADSIALADANRRLDLALVNSGKTVDRWREVKVPVYLPANATASDTIRSLANRLSSCYEAGDSLAASIVPLRTACTAYRDTATRSIANLREGIARRDSLLERREVVKRVQPYGEGLYDAVNRRPVFRVGTTSKLFWKLHGKAEAEYAIPSATKAESGDGLRILAGAQLRF
jgi:hypothetical protein